MNFLWPAAWGFLALAAPIILFYLIRQRLRVKPVSTLLFWQNLTPKVHNLPLWRKLRRLVSLLLQLLLLTLLVTSLARPARPGQSAAATSLILVLDPTVTMGAKTADDRTRWQEATDRAVHRIDSLGFGDEAAVIVAGNPPHILSPWTGRKQDLDRLIGTVTVAPDVTDIRPALRLAQNLAVGRPGAVIELVSDTVWAAPPDKDQLAGLTLDVISPHATNSGLTLLSVRPLPTGGGEFELVAKVEQNTDQPVTGQLTLNRNGSLMDVVEVTVPPGHPWQKSWRGQSTAGADFTAVWKPAGEDALAADQQASAHLDPVRTLKAVLVSAAQPFIEIALGSLPLVTSQRVTAPAPGNTADLWVFHNVVPPAGWSAKNVVLINPPGAGFWGERVGPIEKPLVSETDKNAPVMRFVDLGEVRLRDATESKPPPGAHVYAECFGKPLVFGHWESEPRWLVVAFDFDQSDFALRTAFPILCANLVSTLRPESVANRGGVPGALATRMQPLAAGSTTGPAAAVASAGWWSVIPWWWWFAAGALLLLMAEWVLYTRRVTE